MDAKKWLDQVNTEVNACSLEVLRASNRNSDSSLLMIGCYELNEETRERKGQLRLYSCGKEGSLFSNDETSGAPHLSEPVFVCECPGVLDGKWITFGRDNDQKHFFASATAKGCVDVHILRKFGSGGEIKIENVISGNQDSNTICLALDYISTQQSFSSQILSSYSNGEIAIADFCINAEKIGFEERVRFNAHKLFGCASEVWSCSYFSTNTILTGADDCKLKGWDLRATSSPTFVIGESEHHAGVTCISKHPRKENIFASGSYDEGLRIWDIRRLGTKGSEPLLKLDSVGGGVWRIKWHPEDENKMLVAAMHGGCRILRINEWSHEEQATLEVVNSFTEHKSMAYGADWIESKSDKKSIYQASSCSFYDQKAYIW